ncbi:MAG: hypothetical protein LBG42_05465 [Treponema sp.]|jgi:uncharacterized protein (TIGR03545 family)|nr:hypothetical protein [Treponema sp.]
MKKVISRRVFEKWYVKNIPNAEDRNFFASCFEARDTKMVLREGLSPGDMRRLKTLRRVIADNRRFAVKAAPLAVIGLVIFSLVVFFTFFMNPLLERALERGLEALFEARADVDNFHLNVFHFRVGIDAVTVANRNEPMKNLFQLGRMEFRLNPVAVLRGKIYIEEIRTGAIRFGTDRTVSGALPGRAAAARSSRQQAEAPPLVDLRNFDAMGLLDREFDKLSTPKLYDTAVASYNAALEKWKGQVELVKNRKDELAEKVRQVTSLNAGSLNDVQAITGAVRDITALLDSVQAAANDAANLVNGLDADIKTALALERQARSAITEDFNHLKSYLDFGSGEAFAALEPSIREVLSDTAEQYLDYGLLALDALAKLKASQDAKPKQEKPPKTPAFRGRDVAFPSKEYPKFYLGILATDFTVQHWRTGFDLRGVSSNPDLSGVPVALALSIAETDGSLAREVDFRGSADFRTAASGRFTADVSGRGFPVSLEKEFAQMGIGGFRGDVNFGLDFSGRPDGVVAGDGSVGISGASLINPSGTLAEAIDAAVKETDNLLLSIRYVHNPSAEDEFGISTNIGDLVKRALDRIVRAYAARAMDELERVLRERIGRYIDGKFVSREELDLIFRAARGDKAALDGLKNTLDAKKNELEQWVRNAANQAVEQVKDDTKRQAEQALQDVLQGKTPSFQPPSVPTLPKLPF